MTKRTMQLIVGDCGRHIESQNRLVACDIVI
jgi:hypothetical protein